jgi:hypothetical protein
MPKYHVTFEVEDYGRATVLLWVKREWEHYANAKFQDSKATADADMRADQFSDDGFWMRQVLQYWRRAQVFNLESLRGRQQAVKALTTMIDACASMVRVFGVPSRPGTSSSEEAQPWVKGLFHNKKEG